MDSLRKAVSLVLKALEEAGVEFTHGPDGSIRGVVRSASSSIAAKSNLSASAVVEQFLDRAALQIDLKHREKESKASMPLSDL